MSVQATTAIIVLTATFLTANLSLAAAEGTAANVTFGLYAAAKNVVGQLYCQRRTDGNFVTVEAMNGSSQPVPASTIFRYTIMRPNGTQSGNYTLTEPLQPYTWVDISEPTNKANVMGCTPGAD